MMRKGAVVAALAVAVTAPAASGAARSCRIVVDAVGDETPHDGIETPVDVPDVDLVSGDLASSATQMVAVVRLRGLADQPTPGVGAQYALLFQVGDQGLRVSAVVRDDGLAEGRLTTYDVRAIQPSTDVAPVRVVVDRALDEVRMTFALKPLARYGSIRRGTYVKVRWIEAFLALGLPPAVVQGERVDPGFALAFDHGEEGPRAYRLGARSCVTVPR